MKLGIICPAKFVTLFAIQSDFHLILPHLYEEHPEYADFYRARAQAGDFVVQDNSVFELTYSLDGKLLHELAVDMQVSEMVAPEVLNDAAASEAALYDFLEFRAGQSTQVPVQAVIQGSTPSELLDQFFKYNSIIDVSTIGLPFDLEHQFTEYSFISSLTLRRVLSRWALVDLISAEAENRGIYNIKPVHLMGLSDGVELQKYASNAFPWIRSNDSSSAFVHGCALIKYTDRGLPCEKISKKLDFGLTELTATQKQVINFNIAKLHSFIRSGSV